MARRKSKAKVDSAHGVRSSKATRVEEPAGNFMEVGKEVVPGIWLRRHLSRASRNHPPHSPGCPADDSSLRRLPTGASASGTHVVYNATSQTFLGVTR